MSLDADIGNLVAASQSLVDTFEAKENDIQQQVNAALATIPENKKTFYVDAINGDDTNLGNFSAPIKTLDQAIKRTPYAGYCRVFLLSDYHLDRSIFCGCSLYINGRNGNDYHTITSQFTPNESGDIDRIGGIRPELSVSLQFEYCNIELPADVTGNILNSHTFGLINHFESGSPPKVSVKLSSCNVTHNGGSMALLTAMRGTHLTLITSSTTFQSGFEGRLVLDTGGVGVDPETVVRKVVTNLTFI
jgi:hypothetical protein